MTIKASADAGESWPAKWQLLIDERGSFGYSAQTGIDNHTIGLLYEGIRELYFVRIPIKDILKER
jgi:sialidase-1